MVVIRAGLSNWFQSMLLSDDENLVSKDLIAIKFLPESDKKKRAARQMGIEVSLETRLISISHGVFK